ncbi:MAG: YlbF family regulator [Clostridia bacterium]|nr:YlbF family regulator [Clostridia bacterium]
MAIFEEIQKKTEELAELLSQHGDYIQYKAAREKAMENETTRALLKQYNDVRVKLQANQVIGVEDEELNKTFKNLNEILSMNRDAVNYLVLEYKVTSVMGYVYETLSKAVKLDGVIE